MLNKIILMGRLVRDPEFKATASGVSVASFTVACDRDFQRGGSEQKTDFVDCVAWRKTGEFVSKYFHKGNMIAVSGRLQIRDWTDNSGGKRRNAEIAVEDAWFCGDKAQAGEEKPVQVNFTDLPDEDGGELPF
jgi:single-strand DNA-binding protein